MEHLYASLTLENNANTSNNMIESNNNFSEDELAPAYGSIYIFICYLF
jgi:hypothetical protein